MPQLRPRAVVRVVAPILILVAFAAVAAVAAAGVVLPRCGTCHTSPKLTKATAAGAHAKVDCAACHVGGGVSARVSFAFQEAGHLTAAVVPVDASGLRTVDDARCLACHAEVRTQVSDTNGLRIKHAVCAKGARCTDCHSATAHGTASSWAKSYDMDKCLHCHGTDPKLSDCDLCHVGRSTKDRMTSGPWKVTHGANWRKTHGMGDTFTCGTCHPKGYCDRCHGVGLPHGPDFRTTHPESATDPKAQCFTCHKKTFCTDCHGLQMPHPKTFITQHSAKVKADGRAVCEQCHSKQDCTKCHEMHVHPGGAALEGSQISTAGR